MCLQDWRLGRLIRAVPAEYPLTVGASVTIPSNKQRVGLTIRLTEYVFATTQFLSIAINGVDWTFIHATKPDIHVTVATHGDLPMQEWVLTATGTGMDPSVVEYFLPEEFLTAGLEEFKKAVGL